MLSPVARCDLASTLRAIPPRPPRFLDDNSSAMKSPREFPTLVNYQLIRAMDRAMRSFPRLGPAKEAKRVQEGWKKKEQKVWDVNSGTLYAPLGAT